MQLLDVNVLIHAFREELQDHAHYRDWLGDLAASGESFAIPDIVLTGFLRLVTNSRIFRPGTPWRKAISFVERIREQPGYLRLAPGPRHWDIFLRLSEDARATGDLVTNTYLAALAIEHGCEMATNDRDFARFPGLRWRCPLA